MTQVTTVEPSPQEFESLFDTNEEQGNSPPSQDNQEDGESGDDETDEGDLSTKI